MFRQDKMTDAGPRRIDLFLPSLIGGGAERVFVHLANEFTVRNYRVRVLLASAHGPYLDELNPSVKIVDFRTSGVMRALPKLVRYLRREDPDVLLSGLDHANIVAIIASVLARRGTRSVISSRSIPSIWYRHSGSLRSWVLLQLMRLTYRFADAIIVNSIAGASDLERLLRLPSTRMSVILNPVDIEEIEQLSQANVPGAWCHSDEPPLILGVGRLDALKDFQTLIRAFALVRPQRACRLVILGEGPQRYDLEYLVKELGIQEDVCLPGFVANPFPSMRSADVLVSSSLSEGCPNVVMQALACGTPVVSTDCVGGSAEVLEGGKWGALIPVGDADAMADAIVRTLDATDTSDGRLRARDFSPEIIVRQYLQVLLPDHSYPARIN